MYLCIRGASIPEGSYSLPVVSNKPTLNCAAFANIARNEYCIHMVNNGASCTTTIEGLPTQFCKAEVYCTNAEDSLKESTVDVKNGKAVVDLPPVSFITIILKD